MKRRITFQAGDRVLLAQRRGWPWQGYVGGDAWAIYDCEVVSVGRFSSWFGGIKNVWGQPRFSERHPNRRVVKVIERAGEPA